MGCSLPYFIFFSKGTKTSSWSRQNSGREGKFIPYFRFHLKEGKKIVQSSEPFPYLFLHHAGWRPFDYSIVRMQATFKAGAGASSEPQTDFFQSSPFSSRSLRLAVPCLALCPPFFSLLSPPLFSSREKRGGEKRGPLFFLHSPVLPSISRVWRNSRRERRRKEEEEEPPIQSFTLTLR